MLGDSTDSDLSGGSVLLPRYLMCPRQAGRPLVPDQWRRLTSLGISRSKPMHCRCRRGLKSDARWLQNGSE